MDIDYFQKALGKFNGGAGWWGWKKKMTMEIKFLMIKE